MVGFELDLEAALRELQEPGLVDRARRAAANGVPVSVQGTVDRMQPMRLGQSIVLGGNYPSLARKHDLSRALLERLRRRPYMGLGYDIADLPEHQLARIVHEIEALAFDAARSLVVRTEAINALGQMSLARVMRGDRTIERTDGPDDGVGYEGTRVVPSRLVFVDRLRALHRDPTTPAELRAVCAEHVRSFDADPRNLG